MPEIHILKSSRGTGHILKEGGDWNGLQSILRQMNTLHKHECLEFTNIYSF